MSMDRRLAYYRRAIEAPFDPEEEARFYYEVAKAFLEKLDQIEDERFAQSSVELGWLSIAGFSTRRLVRQIRDENGVVLGWSSLENGNPSWNSRSYPNVVFEPLSGGDL